MSTGETLYSLMVGFGADMSDLDNEIDRSKGKALAAGDAIGNRLSDGLIHSLQGRLGGGGILNTIFGGTASGAAGAGIIGLVTNLGTAASKSASQLNFYRSSLISISGDAKTAEDALRRFQRIAGDSNFDTPQVMALGSVLAGRSGNVGQAATETGEIVDASAVLRITNGTFNAFQTNLGQILAKQNGKLDVEDVRQLRTYAPGIAVQIAKSQGISLDKANNLLDTGTGKQLYEAILKIGEQNKGAAARDSNSSPGGIVANIMQSVSDGLAPTGGIINTLITPVLQLGKGLADGFAEINTFTGGILGLQLMAGTGLVALKLLYTGGRAAWSGIVRLTTAIDKLAISSEIASKRIIPGGGTVPITAGNEGSTNPGGIGGIIGFVRTLKTGAGWVNLGTTALKGLKTLGPGVASLGAEWIGGSMQQSDNEGVRHAGRYTKNIGEFAGWGGIASLLFGPEAMPVGYGLGALAGLGKSVYQDVTGEGAKLDKKDSTASNSKDAQVKALEENTNALKMNAKAWGGGERVRGSIGIIEREYAAYHLMRAGLSGIG